MKGREIWILIVGFLGQTMAEENLEFSSSEVAKLATHAYGTEFLLLENSHYTDQTASYKFEDFFWTGSGDGPTTDEEENVWISSDGPAIVYKTSTVVSTVFVESPSTQSNESSTVPTTNCSFNCHPPTTATDEIIPTPTLAAANQQFWLLTVLRTDGRDPVLVDIRNSLAKLYKMAFQRQQARHLKLQRQKRGASPNGVDVFVHEIHKQRQQVELLYHVEVLGRPVDAFTAADDMKLVSDDEVRQELGFLFDVKAEPYVKPSEPQSLLNKAKNTWFVIGGSIIGVLVILLVLAFIILGATKGKRPQSQQSVGAENRRHVFERGAGYENKGLVQDEDSATPTGPSPTYVHFGERHQVAPGSVSSSSGSSSLDISPLVSRKPTKRPRAALNKTVPLNAIRRLPSEVLDSDSAGSRKEDFMENFDPGVVSPKSYLSMPSVKSFPRNAMPEPLIRVLEPVSMTHLDTPHEDDEIYSRKHLVRHGSVGTVEDPGVIGPIVWNMHCEKLRHDQPQNVSKMRKRFHDLLDDTFSLFGNSRRASPDVDDRPIAIEVKSHSANENRLAAPTIGPRPKTTGAQKPGPSCAWRSSAPSPMTRPLSAAPSSMTPAPGGDFGVLRAPRVNVEHVLAEGRFRPSDPAISVIEAIKGELEKVSLPGSSYDLNK